MPLSYPAFFVVFLIFWMFSGVLTVFLGPFRFYCLPYHPPPSSWQYSWLCSLQEPSMSCNAPWQLVGPKQHFSRFQYTSRVTSLWHPAGATLHKPRGSLVSIIFKLFISALKSMVNHWSLTKIARARAIYFWSVFRGPPCTCSNVPLLTK